MQTVFPEIKAYQVKVLPLFNLNKNYTKREQTNIFYLTFFECFVICMKKFVRLLTQKTIMYLYEHKL